MTEIKPGEVFKSYRTDIEPPKVKIQICINDNSYLLINTNNNYGYELPISKKECSLLDYDSYICCRDVFSSYNKNSKIIDKSQLSRSITEKLIQYLPHVPTLTPIKVKSMCKSLQEYLNSLPKEES